jgi:hypothetical protein
MRLNCSPVQVLIADAGFPSGNSSCLSSALDDLGIVGPSPNISDIPSRKPAVSAHLRLADIRCEFPGPDTSEN